MRNEAFWIPRLGRGIQTRGETESMVGQFNMVGNRYGWTLEVCLLNLIDDRFGQTIRGYEAGSAPGHFGEQRAAKFVYERHGTQVDNACGLRRFGGVCPNPRYFVNPRTN